jgi:CBS domain-containing protein
MATINPEKQGTQDLYAFLKDAVPFKYLDDLLLREIIDRSEVKEFPENSFVFREGERSKNRLFFIIKGQAKAIAKVGGEESVATIRNPGSFFGVTVFLSDEPYPVSMLASKDLTCLLISLESFHKALIGSNRFADFFTQELASRLKELYQTFSDDRDEGQLARGQNLRRRVADIYTAKVITALPMDKIGDVAKKMSSANVSSVVVKTVTGKPVGIITEKDLVRKVVAAENFDLDRRAHEIMSSDLVTVRPGNFTYQALLMMIKNNITHVVVTDEHDVLHGIVTIKDLIRTGNSGALSIVRQIEFQDSFAGLAKVIGEIDQVQQALLDERSYASEICAIISELYDRVTRRVIRIAEEQMISENRGNPPANYCFISMGSAGRKEQFSRTDQDNGIIFEDLDGKLSELAAEYFLLLGSKIVRGLEECGFKRCPGEVMADNPRWCKPLSRWKKSVEQWVDQLDGADIRNMTIFLDNRFLSGDQKLYNKLSDYTAATFRKAAHALLFMAEDDLRHRIPLNLFRRIITEKSGKQRNKLNLKNAAMVHMVDCLRIFALREGIRETNTFERIHKLKERGIFRPDDAEYIEAAYEALLMFRIRDALQKMKQGEEPDNFIDPEKLTRKENTLLKESLLMAGRLQSLTEHAFHVHRA